MKVLLINRNDFVDGGADRVFLNTVELLSDMDFGFQVSGIRYQVEKFTRQDAGMDSSVDPRSLSVWGKLRLVKDYLYNRKVSRSLKNKIVSFKPDVAHVHLIFGTLSGSVLRTLKKQKVPVVMTVHDYRLLCPANAMLDRHGKICEKCRKTRYYQCFFRRCSEGNLLYSAMIMLEAYLRKWFIKPIKLVDRFIFVSDFARGKHISYDKRYADKSIRLYNMTDEKAEQPAAKGDYFLFFGRISKEKGLTTLIKAIKGKNIKLVIAGRGPQEEEVSRMADAQPIINGNQSTDHNIEFAGFKSGNDLERLIRNCSFVVVPSEWYENNPMTVVEAFALGKPVIGARIGGIPELVTSGTGFLFESGDPLSLSEAISNANDIEDKEYQRLSRNCLEFAQTRFGRREHLRNLEKIYKMVV